MIDYSCLADYTVSLASKDAKDAKQCTLRRDTFRICSTRHSLYSYTSLSKRTAIDVRPQYASLCFLSYPSSLDIFQPCIDKLEVVMRQLKYHEKSVLSLIGVFGKADCSNALSGNFSKRSTSCNGSRMRMSARSRLCGDTTFSRGKLRVLLRRCDHLLMRLPAQGRISIV